MSDFVHLHVASHYSLLESAIEIEALVDRAKQWNQSALALTDRGNMFGAVDFYHEAKDKGVKPILGCEIFYTTGSRFEKPDKKARRTMLHNGAAEEEAFRLFNLVLLVKNAAGYKSLCEIVSRSYTEGAYQGKPRADRELIEKFSEGLICLTSGLKGEMGYRFMRSQPEKAEAAGLWLQKVFKEDLFFELCENGLPEQALINSAKVDLAEKMGVGVVATAQAHCLDKSSRFSLEALMCISSGRTLSNLETSGPIESTNGFYLKSPDEMAQDFLWKPEALSNTKLVADRCNFKFQLKDEKGRQIYHLPHYDPWLWSDANSKAPIHEGNQNQELFEKAKDEQGRFSVEKYLRLRSEEGLRIRFESPHFKKLREASDWEEKKKAYHARLEEELDMIIKTGFSGYFLIVSDFILYAKSQGIPVGPGRGSGAGSLVAYVLKITDIDPIPFNLLFERFINPERISMPDFDVDFCQDRRGEVIHYVIQKYGRESVSQIITFGKLLARSVIRDAGRVLALSYAEVDAIAKLIPEELGITLEDAFAKESRLKEACEKDIKVEKLFEIARNLEGLNRNAGIHAAGVVITNLPLVEYCPVFTGKENETVVQFDKDFAEKIGLVKFDFLGLKTLTVIDNAVKFVVQGPNPNFILDHIDYDDKGVYELLSSGDTSGVFQLESSGMQDLCSRVKPSSLEDITSINALYRPGPLESGMVDDFINRKHGRIALEYPHPSLEPILNETYGVIVYQEQVMRVARELAGYSLGEADILRRAMGKKKPEEMAKQKDKFIKGCLDHGVDQEKADFIFELLSKFAAYGFNKSHSAAYGVLSYQTAFLKTYYPAEFMAALMATEMNDTDKLALYVADAKTRGIQVLPPDINSSEKTFSVQGGHVRFGLEAIKGVGGIAVDVIIKERDKGPFKSFLDFARRVSLRKVNKKVLESLISAGAFDSIAEENRPTLFESLEPVMAYAAGIQEQAEVGQVSMFDEFQSQDVGFRDTSSEVLFKRVADWSESQKLQQEKALVGFYVSGHPMEKQSKAIGEFIHGDLFTVAEEFEKRKTTFKPKVQQLDESGRPVWDRSMRDYGKYEVVTAGVIASFREIMTKKGSRMAFGEIEDEKSKLELVIFPEPYQECGALLQRSIKECLPCIVTGQLDLNESSPKLLLRSMDTIHDFKARKVSSVLFRVNPAKVKKSQLTLFREILLKHKGRCSAVLEYEGSIEGTSLFAKQTLPPELSVNPSADLVREVNQLFGESVVKFL